MAAHENGNTLNFQSLARETGVHSKTVKEYFNVLTDRAEVDLVLEREGEIWAVEIKASSNPTLSAVRGLRSFIKDHKYHRALCVCLTPRAFQDGEIEFLPWAEFLRQL